MSQVERIDRMVRVALVDLVERAEREGIPFDRSQIHMTFMAAIFLRREDGNLDVDLSQRPPVTSFMANSNREFQCWMLAQQLAMLSSVALGDGNVSTRGHSSEGPPE